MKLHQAWLPLDVFAAGERLVIVPHDTDDPEANQRSGQTCTFVKMSAHGFAIVRFEPKGRNFYFRPTDLQKAEAQP